MEILVHEIFWNQNSPYGGYLANDYVKIFWDDVTESLRVYNNNVEVFSGNDIPFSFSYSGNPDTYYKTEYHYYTLVCNIAKEKVDTYRLISSFPYLNLVRFPNHPSCADAPVVCDLKFDSLPEIVKASGSNISDGEINVSASSSNGAIEYELNSDFVYGEGQSSGFFAGLVPGEYTIYARDEINCFASISVSVGIDYNYGAKYRLEYTDELGNESRIDILEKEYSGLVTEVIGFTDNPFQIRLRGEGERDKFKPILSTETQLNLVSETNFQFLELFTSDPEKYRLEFSKDTGSGFDRLLLHKLLPNQYEETYVAPPYDTSFIAIDGTANLKDIPFTDVDGNKLIGEYKQITIIAFCLQKIGLPLGIRSGINLYADGMDATDSDDPLDQAYVDVARYYFDEKNTPNCEEVLSKLLMPYGAQIKQWGGFWNIQRQEERTGSYDYREFDENGVYVSEGTYNPIKDIGNAQSTSLTWRSNPSMQTLPGFGKIKINYDLGLRQNLLKNGDFRLKLVYSPYTQSNVLEADTDGFLLANNGGGIIANGYEVIDNDNVAILLYSNSNAYIISEPIRMIMGISDKIKIIIRFKLPIPQRDYPYQKIKIRVTYGSFYLQSDGYWTGTDTTITYYAKEFGKYVEFELVANQPDTNASSGYNIQIQLFGSFAMDADFSTLSDLKNRATTTLPIDTRTELLPSSTGSGVRNDTIYYYELQNNTESESAPDIVRPNDYNSSTNPYQWVLQSKKGKGDLNGFFWIDRISINYLPQGSDAPKFLNSEIAAETNNPDELPVEVFHGSLVDSIQTNLAFIVPVFLSPYLAYVTIGNQNSENSYFGYLRDSSGVGFVNWTRDNVPESRMLHDIHLRVLSAQYSRPWRKIMGIIYGSEYFYPIDTVREMSDGNKFYIPVSLEINDKRNNIQGEFMELISVTEDGGEPGEPGSGAGFTTGFTIGFDS